MPGALGGGSLLLSIDSTKMEQVKDKEDGSGEDGNESEEESLTLEKQSDLQEEATEYCKPEWPRLHCLIDPWPSLKAS